jgi:tRNA pseudouridine38-40 synthase
MHNHLFHYKIIISYDGTNYKGWQIQPNGVSVQEVIQNTMDVILKEKVVIRGSGRTDTGVHAKAQVAHFKYGFELDSHRFLYSMNSLLPADIRILSIEKTTPDFHAQHSATGKTYHYHIHLNAVFSPFKYKHSWHIHQSLNLAEMEKAAIAFLGTHDFTSFANEAHLGACAKDPVRTLKRLDIIHEEGGIRLEFEGDGFLYKMVRNITGFLVDVGRGRRNASDLQALFAAKNRQLASKAAPACGLFLVTVHYT